ncbi:MAG TPA: ABC transporter substrate-binding protein [Pirellulales bacterium]|nr:ABC transporter substrate-binding protein [Pirellulales bacterium]
MKRRDFIVGAAALATPTLTRAESETKTAKRPLIGILALSASEHDDSEIQAFVEALAQLGYVDGQTATILRSYGNFDVARLAVLAAALAVSSPDVILADTASPIKAARNAAPNIPIVGAAMSYPIEQGLIASFSRPGGNITGVASQVEDMDSKILELMNEIIRDAKSVGLLLNPNATLSELEERDLRAAARKLGIGFEVAEARQPSDIEGAIGKLARDGVSFLAMQPNTLFVGERIRIMELANAAHLPTVSTQATNDLIGAGAFLIYSANYPEPFRRAAVFVDKIIKGARPGDLPVEFPTRLRLAINLKTAKALGITIPQSVLLRADEVIE